MFFLSVYSVVIGKTMTANAVADHLKKKVLLITLSLVIEKDLTKVIQRGSNYQFYLVSDSKFYFERD